MKELQELIKVFKEDRPTMKEANTPHFIFTLLLLEVQELLEAIETADSDEVEHELADVLFLALEMANCYEIDAEEAVKTKAARNVLKYQWQDFQDGNYLEAVQKSKSRWNGGDIEFYS